MIPGDLLSACPQRPFHTLPGLLDSRAALSNSNPNALCAMQGGSLYHFYDGLWYDPAWRRTHDLYCVRGRHANDDVALDINCFTTTSRYLIGRLKHVKTLGVKIYCPTLHNIRIYRLKKLLAPILSSSLLNILFKSRLVWLVVFYVPIYCTLRSSVFTPFPLGIEPRVIAWQSITLPLRHASSTQ